VGDRASFNNTGHRLNPFFSGRGDLLQVPPGAGEEPAEVQQPDEEQAVVLRVRHVGTVFVVLQKSPRKH
jgi:hypothetical protein